MNDPAPYDRLRAALPLAALIGETTRLIDDGGNVRGSCPFHPDAAKGLYVDPAGRFYHCFSCGRHGDLVRWTMDVESVDRAEALMLLADRTGISL